LKPAGWRHAQIERRFSTLNMDARVYWIDTKPSLRLGIMARPRGGDWLEDEIASLHRQGVAALVSLLTNEECSELELGTEAELCEESGIKFFRFPIEDRCVPNIDHETENFVRMLAKFLSQDSKVVIHCRMGIGRASLIAAACLMVLGIPPEKAFAQIASARGCAVPDTPEQREWPFRFREFLAKSG
jgi:protein-tyrosine phosphatase